MDGEEAGPAAGAGQAPGVEGGQEASEAPEAAGAPGLRDRLLEALEALREAHGPEWEPIARLEARRVLVVGDTHGYPEVTRWALRLAVEAGAEAVVFLGDLVDRGPDGVGNLIELAEAARSGGPRVLVVRGDHEILLMNTYYGFRAELEEKAGADEEVIGALEAFYASLPLAALAGPVFLVHGGIPCRKCRMEEEPPYRLDELEATLREELGDPQARADAEAPTAAQLLWNDPRGIIDWFLPNAARGPGAYYYGRLAWKTFLEENGLKLIVRGHEVYDGVHAWLPDGSQEHPLTGKHAIDELEYSVVTVFSSLYHGGRATALLLDLDEGTLEAHEYKPRGDGEEGGADK